MLYEHDGFITSLFLVQVDEADAAHIARTENDFVWEATGKPDFVEYCHFERRLDIMELWLGHASCWETVGHTWQVDALHEAEGGV